MENFLLDFNLKDTDNCIELIKKKINNLEKEISYQKAFCAWLYEHKQKLILKNEN